MSKKRILTLTTDFGTLDGYVGIVKGVILSICPEANIIDLSHELPAWNVSAASWIIGNSYPYFPQGSIHLAVVDPGVGSKRRAVAIEAAGQVFIGPDNGIFSAALQNSAEIKAFELNNDKFWRKELSTTFHARDLFAPAAAHHAAGIALSELGPEIEVASLIRLPIRELKVKANRVEGSVAYVDRFGNLITNISKEHVKTAALCQVGKRSIGRIGHSYHSGDQGTPIAFIGSHGFLEIAVSQGRADEKLDAGVNTAVILFEGSSAS
ncbi:MAG: SAM-dependent chlorinase/fluorinase [Candidatus Obscuribacterales bacterium]|nr:SAM-dependent chlorinase/fluorinase [Candidatus Obscuribacterales bacterium]